MRDYVAKVGIVQGDFADALGALMIQYPVVSDASAANRASADETRRAYESYWSRGLTLVRETQHQWSLIRPPDSARDFHNRLREYADDLETAFLDSLRALRSESAEDMSRVLLFMADLEDDAREIAEWQARLFDESQ